jgi:hypothetical protein
MACLECGLEQAVADAGTCLRCGAPLTDPGHPSGTFTSREGAELHLDSRGSFVSLLSDAGVPTEKIALLVGHSLTTTTERVYRHQIRPVVQGGAQVMADLFVKPGSPDA